MATSTAAVSNQYKFSDIASFRDDVPFRVQLVSNISQDQSVAGAIQTHLPHNGVMDIYSIEPVQLAIFCQHQSLNAQPISHTDYIIPLNSSLKCSPLYNPKGNISEAINGYTFYSVNQVQQSIPRPTAVYVCTGFLGEDVDNSMEADDVYIIKPTDPGSADHGDDHGATLTCEDAVTGQSKYLHCDTLCNLNTCPSNTILKLSQFAPSLPLPAEIVIYCDDPGSDSPVVLTVSGLIPLLSVIVSINNSPPVVLEVYGQAESFPVAFQPLHVSPSRQRAMNIQQDNELASKELMIFVMESSENPSMKMQFTDDRQQLFFSSRQESETKDNVTLQLISAIQIKSKNFKLKDDTVQRNTSVEAILEENIRILKSFTVEDICDLLVQLGIVGQCCDLFKSEQVSGILLLELTDEILSQELGMHRKLDRIKIQQIQQGKRAIRDIMNKQS